VQKEIPIWLTGQSDDTFRAAGELGFSVLTANFALRHDQADFERKVGIYRDAIHKHHGKRGHVTLMAHTFAADSLEEIRSIARPALAKYLAVNLGMQKDHSAGKQDKQGFAHLSARESEILIRNQVQNDLTSPLSFIGTTDHCAAQAERLQASGVDEIACLIDFGIPFDDVLASLRRLATIL
jgi:alkanesulfonate monooxygenase SsuD/methylene tetrahydromethanopterin reductase-like flavin-dependent oxidoreductase (luciferase family)